MNLIIWLLIGGLIGWVASMVMGTNGRQGVLLDVVVGIVGAILGGWLLGSTFGPSAIDQDNFSLSGLVVSLLGAILLLAFVRLAPGVTSH
jgi:uncharacterized membrane protein YeaQ/YmgE (transglycosylase-associated protein family)